VLGIMLAMFLGALDQTIVATALPTIGRHCGNLNDLSWVVTAYLLTGTAVTPLYGKLADIHGRRVLMLTAIGIFIVGSAACALAPSMTALVLARGFQGLGGGGLMALAQTIIADIVSPRERGRYQGYIGAVFAVSSVGGPVLGGFLTEHIDWSLIFWINLPLGLVALGMTSSVLRRVPFHPRKHRLDVIGALLMMWRRWRFCSHCRGAAGVLNGSRRKSACCCSPPRSCGACSRGGWFQRANSSCR